MADIGNGPSNVTINDPGSTTPIKIIIVKTITKNINNNNNNDDKNNKTGSEYFVLTFFAMLSKDIKIFLQ